MPIVGMTNSKPQPTQIARLRKGEEKKGNAPGKDLDYFRLDPVDPKDAPLADKFNELHNGKPNHLRVYFPFATAAQNFEAWREEYAASGLKHRCDGVHVWDYDKATGELYNTGEPCPYLNAEKKECKQTGRLFVILLDLLAEGRFGITTALTTSIHDIVNLSDALAYYEIMAGGELRGVPFILSRRPVAISTPSGKDGGRARREKWLIFVEPAQEWVGHRLEVSRRLALSAPAAPQLVDEEGEIIEGTSNPAPPTFQDLMDCGSEWGLTEDETKQILKDAGFSAYHPSRFDAMKETITATVDESFLADLGRGGRA